MTVPRTVRAGRSGSSGVTRLAQETELFHLHLERLRLDPDSELVREDARRARAALEVGLLGGGEGRTAPPWTCRKCGMRSPRASELRRRAEGTCRRSLAARSTPPPFVQIFSYQHYVELNGGSSAGFGGGAVQKEGGSGLHRDHDHKTGLPRGVLCFRDNSALRYMTVEWLENALAYLKRTGGQAWHDPAFPPKR